ncbi:MAG: hypothetical protein HFF64_05690 [Oscillospiraceae bacterium]|nr:hypothetical protein [Oscillospiraceae bacterium]
MAAVQVDLQAVAQVADVIVVVALSGAPIDGIARPVAAAHVLLIVSGENLVDLVPGLLLAGNFHLLALLDDFIQRIKDNIFTE